MPPIAALIDKALLAKGLGAQTRLAANVRVSQPTVAKGVAKPGPRLWPSIEAALDLPPGPIATASGDEDVVNEAEPLRDRRKALESELSDLRKFVIALAARIEERWLRQRQESP